MEEHKAKIGVFAIPKDEQGRGLWSKRADGKGVNAIGGMVDSNDSANKSSLQDVLKREFLEETGLEVEVDFQPIGVFPNADLTDIAILYPVRIVGGGLRLSSEAVEHLWMDREEVRRRAELYDKGDKANGLVSGTGKRQWKMAGAFFNSIEQKLP